MPGKQGSSASVCILPSSGSVDSQDIGDVWEATIARSRCPIGKGDNVPTIYVLLLLTLLVFVLYVTWRPSSKKSAHSAPKQRPILNATRDVAATSKVADLPTLEFRTSNARGNSGATHGR
jgi:hypothetical protein